MAGIIDTIRLGWDGAPALAGLKESARQAGRAQESYGRLRAAVGVAVGAISAAVVGMAREHDEARGAIAEATGATGAGLRGLVGDYQSVIQSAVGLRRDSEDVAAAVGALNTHLGVSGARLAVLAGTMVDAGLSAEGAGGLFRGLGVGLDEAGGAMDLLTRLSQEYGPSVDEIARRTVRYRDDLDALGLSWQEQLTLGAQAIGSGQRLSTVVRDLGADTSGWRDELAAVTPSLEDVAGATERSSVAQATFADRIGRVRDAVSASLAPHAESVQLLGSMGTGLGGLAAAAPLAGTAVRGLWAAVTGPAGLAVAAVAGVGAVVWRFRDRVGEVVADVIGWVWDGASRILDGLATVADWLPGGLGDRVSAVADGIEARVEGVQGWLRGIGDAAADGAADLAEGIDVVAVPALVRAAEAGESSARRIEEAFDLASVGAQAQLGAVGDMVPGLLHPPVERAFDLILDTTETKTIEMGALVGGLLTRPDVVDLSTVAPSWSDRLTRGLRETWTSEHVGGVLAQGFVGGGGARGAAQALGSELGGLIGGSIQQVVAERMTTGMSGILGGAINALVPGLGGVIGSLAGKVVGFLSGLGGGGTNVGEDAYQAVVDAVSARAVADDALARQQEAAMAQGHDRRAASVLAFFRRVRTEQGRTTAEADAEFERFHRAQQDRSSEAEKRWARETAAQLQRDHDALQSARRTEEAQAQVRATAYEERMRLTDEEVAAVREAHVAVVASWESMTAEVLGRIRRMDEAWSAAQESVAAGSASTAEAVLGDAARVAAALTEARRLAGDAREAVGRLVSDPAVVEDIATAVLRGRVQIEGEYVR